MPHQPYTVTLPEWEGPLDLLLHVIRAHELDILDIPISFVTEQYLNYLDLMQNLNLDVASEYLEMAATLAYIKSRMMLPRPPAEEEDPEEEIDPREELIRRLLEFQRYKDAAEQLGSLPVLGRDTFVASHAPEEVGDDPMIELGLFELVDAFQRILERTKLDFSHEVSFERITVSERIGELVELITPGELIPFERLLGEVTSKMRFVVTLLALLEMTRLRMTRLLQDRHGTQIFVALRGWGEAADEQALLHAKTGEGVGQLEGSRSKQRKPLPRTLQILARCSRLRRRRPKVFERWTHSTTTRGTSPARAKMARRRNRRR